MLDLSIYSHIQPSNRESYLQISGQPLADSLFPQIFNANYPNYSLYLSRCHIRRCYRRSRLLPQMSDLKSRVASAWWCCLITDWVGSNQKCTPRQFCDYSNTTVLLPYTNTRFWRWWRTDRASTMRSRSLPFLIKSSTSSRWVTRTTSCSIIGPASSSEVI